MGDVTNFADMPKSVSEIRSDKSDNAKDWSVRDALICLLREIDRGETKPLACVICLLEVNEDGKHATDYRSAGGDGVLTNLGLITRVAHRMQRGMDP